MPEHRIYSTPFASVYPHYVKKAEAKGRTREELDEIIRWLTGYTRAAVRTGSGSDWVLETRAMDSLERMKGAGAGGHRRDNAD